MVAVLARYKNCFQCFPAHDELGMCKASLVSPEQPVLCIFLWLTNTTDLTVTYYNISET